MICSTSAICTRGMRGHHYDYMEGRAEGRSEAAAASHSFITCLLSTIDTLHATFAESSAIEDYRTTQPSSPNGRLILGDYTCLDETIMVLRAAEAERKGAAVGFMAA